MIKVGSPSFDQAVIGDHIRIVDSTDRTIWTIDVQKNGHLQIRLANSDNARGFYHCDMLIEPHVSNSVTLKQQA